MSVYSALCESINKEKVIDQIVKHLESHKPFFYKHDTTSEMLYPIAYRVNTTGRINGKKIEILAIYDSSINIFEVSDVSLMIVEGVIENIISKSKYTLWPDYIKINNSVLAVDFINDHFCTDPFFKHIT